MSAVFEAQARPHSVAARSTRERAQAIMADWAATGQADTRAALVQFPELQLDKPLMMELIAEEYIRRTLVGQQIDLNLFCEQFPDHYASVREMVAGLSILRNNLDVLDEAAGIRVASPGEQLGEFQIIRELGQGGFARVYLAVHQLTGRQEVLKISRPDGSKEPRVMGQLDHPNVVTIRDARLINESTLAIVMPYLGASTLLDLLDIAFHPSAPRRGGPALREAIDRNIQAGDQAPAQRGETAPLAANHEQLVLFLAAELAHGLAHLHAQGICHRDLKPSNVLLSWCGRPVIVDFNLAVDPKVNLSHGGGTLHYMAPEQIATALARTETPDIGLNADLFSFGAIVYELLTGRLPFSSPPGSDALSRERTIVELAAWLHGQHQSGCLPLRQHLPAIDPDFERLILQCLRFDPADRPASAAALAAELDRLRRPRNRPRWRRRLLAATCLAALAGSGAYYLAMRPLPAVQPAAASMESARRALSENDPPRALGLLDELLKVEPNNAEAYFLRAQARIRLNDPNLAIIDLAKARDLTPDARIDASLAYAYAMAKNYDWSIAHADLAQASHGESAALFNNRAHCHFRLIGNNQGPDHWKPAATDLARALELDPNLMPAHVNRADLYRQLWRKNGRREDLDQAVDSIRRAIELGPPSAQLYKLGADILATRAKFVDADWETTMAWLREAIRLGLNPNDLIHHPSLRLRRGRPEFEALLAMTPGSPSEPAEIHLVDPLAGTP